MVFAEEHGFEKLLDPILLFLGPGLLPSKFPLDVSE